MLLTTILSFFGGNAFRMIWGEVSAWLTARQEHAHELTRLQAQEKIDAAQHARNLEAIRLQHSLGVEVIHVQAEAAEGRLITEAWAELAKSTSRPIGIWWIDAWNGSIRPAMATWAAAMLSGAAFGWWTLDEGTLAVCGAALGLYLADRSLFKRGK